MRFARDRNCYGTRKRQDDVAEEVATSSPLASVFQYSHSLIHTRSSHEPCSRTLLRTQKHCVERLLDTESSLRFNRNTHASPAKAKHTHLETSSFPGTATGAPRNWTPPFTAHLPDGERRNELRTCPSALSCPLMCSTTCHTRTQLPLPCSNYASRYES